MTAETDFRSHWTRLHDLAHRVVPDDGEDSGDAVFLPIGLHVHDPAGPLVESDHAATPAGAITFASTGGDGVHFSAVPAGDARPVVMTVPMAFENPNHVVGADLPEFLALGCRTGYSALERLAYSWGAPEVIRSLQAAVPVRDSFEQGLLTALVVEFDLEPWRDPAARLASLGTAYRSATRPRLRRGPRPGEPLM
ncbi:hypothetical protein ACIQMJ_35010 [Actinosynnema sp. NPDC091369]